MQLPSFTTLNNKNEIFYDSVYDSIYNSMYDSIPGHAAQYFYDSVYDSIYDSPYDSNILNLHLRWCSLQQTQRP